MKTIKLDNIPFLAIAIAIAGFFIGDGIYDAMTRRTVTVKGLAEREVAADMAIWNIKFSRSGADLAKVQQNIDLDTAKTRDFLIKSGFAESDIQNLRVSVRDKAAYGNEMGITDRYVIETGVMLRSKNVTGVDNASRQMGDLVRQGVMITEDYAGPVYTYGGLNDIKISMIESATKNATDAGEQFAKDAGAKLGKIASANQGVFSIEARDATDQWSSNEKQAIDKKVRVVSTITFYLK
ncbi:MAG: SIMPL domain-containing protein [Rickettsiales bacterium]|jgi:hypothetical protein|nr:SIMPL domain-containing protein [Rickettsiales bacterium]